MCGRFALTLPSDAMAQMFDAVPANDLPDVPNYNVCPTTKVHAVVARDGGRDLSALRWGFLPKWYKTMSGGPLLINARSETIAEKPAFRAACRERRCLIPVTGFYEWTKTPEGNRLPWYFHRADEEPLVFAGVWQDWTDPDTQESLRTCAIVTCGANERLHQIHHRMPVILAPDDWAMWLGEGGKGAARLMRPAPDQTLDFYRVDAAVNSNRAKGPDLIEPITD